MKNLFNSLIVKGESIRNRLHAIRCAANRVGPRLMNHKSGVPAAYPSLGAEERNDGDRSERPCIIKNDLDRRLSEDIVYTNSVRHGASGGLEQEMGALNTSSAGYGYGVCDPLYGLYVHTTDKKPIDLLGLLRQQGFGTIAHVIASRSRSESTHC